MCLTLNSTTEWAASMFQVLVGLLVWGRSVVLMFVLLS